MKTPLLILAAAGLSVFGGCASKHVMAPTPQPRDPGASSSGFGYDDRQIARIQRGETAEPQLLESFGLPDNRLVKPDGRAQLSWSFSSRTDGGPGHSGVLVVSFTPDGKVEAYSARGGPMEENRTVDFVARSEADMRKYMEQWRREGWSVSSISAPIPQADLTVHRKAELSRSDSGNASGFGYDDRQIAKIERSRTTQAELLEWFGPPHSRSMKADGRAELSWTFASRTDGGPGHTGELHADLAPGGNVDSYSARRGPG